MLGKLNTFEDKMATEMVILGSQSHAFSHGISYAQMS